MRSRKYRVVTTLEGVNNRLVRLALQAGFAPRAFAPLETTGRRSGLLQYTPVGSGLQGDTFWLVAAHGTQADYVRNLQANPRVRSRQAAHGARVRPSFSPRMTRLRGQRSFRTSGTPQSGG
jgi:deazaflavin-dependent oxidoreductase (nitroreductase family)